ncbi:ATP-dependent helicase HrpB [Brevibacillus panacihumi]|uniref:ATP-dependent helicase HrpB n=1 Tax=Brevibacillus panacihumi TaxID=497735 RepID=A0A3M8C1X5_9BACL|nr:ATP-dependent helicase HrpB [Brevibacillus panacihumi]RNB69629.1 ATP-dependent helicase HrpB [Brevibacillus panacihumi]
MTVYPIDHVLPECQEALRIQGSAVLIAEPGAGKTTRVPLALLDEPWLVGQRILLLEPRRLAAKTVARYMAKMRGETVGETVGYRVRQDSRIGPDTRVEVITEGVLTRMLQSDPSLEGVGLLIFDEFHERSLQADLGLALALQARELFRDDLRLLVMSATLDAGPIAALLGDATVITSEGRTYPVETRYLPHRLTDRLELSTVRVIRQALEREEGDILVFLPGAGEIRRVASELSLIDLPPGVQICPLYGALPQEKQDQALQPAKPGERKIVLATSIAETSLTVEGVRVVIDCGLMRVPRFSPRTGMTRLETVPVSLASADQRRGRAGRLGPGVCYRMWTQQEERVMPAYHVPGIKEADLASLALELAAWGVKEPAELSWLDPPPPAAYIQARELLMRLGALDERHVLTAHGKKIAAMGLHPRLGHMLVKADQLGVAMLGCLLAALLGERDILRGSGAGRTADLGLRMQILLEGSQASGKLQTLPSDVEIDRGTCVRVIEEAERYLHELGNSDKPRIQEKDLASIGILVAFAFPDRIAQRRENGRYVLRNGRGAAFPAEQWLSYEKIVVAAQLDDQGTDSRIRLAAALSEAELEQHFAAEIEEGQKVWWDSPSQSVRVRKQKKLGALLLRESSVADPDPDAVLQALLSGIAQEGLEILPWNRQAIQYRQRLQMMHSIEEGWPDVSEEALLGSLDEWLGPHAYGCKTRDDLSRLSLDSILAELLSWSQRRELEEYAPTHIVVPSGSRIPIDYSDPQNPVLAVRLQEVFGWHQTPCIGRGRVPLTLHLLSPARRPVQVTRDLSSFWQQAYFEVKKDLKGRYPKHYWPDDPLQATPTRHTRPQA